jgi:hypothetical protein
MEKVMAAVETPKTEPGKRSSAREKSAQIQQAHRARERRRQRLMTLATVGAATLVGGGLVLMAVLGGTGKNDPEHARDLANVSGLGGEELPPWPAPTDAVGRAEAAGLSIGPMGMADHYHAHLDVIVNGSPVEVPASIGIDAASGAMSGLHTHAADGVLHVEADRVGQPFTLGQLFTEWDVRLTPQQIGGLKTEDGKVLRVYVDGEPTSGNPALIPLEGEQQIAIVFGPADQKVEVPESYDFSGEG